LCICNGQEFRLSNAVVVIVVVVALDLQQCIDAGHTLGFIWIVGFPRRPLSLGDVWRVPGPSSFQAIIFEFLLTTIILLENPRSSLAVFNNSQLLKEKRHGRIAQKVPKGGRFCGCFQKLEATLETIIIIIVVILLVSIMRYIIIAIIVMCCFRGRRSEHVVRSQLQ
jgi:hypothetical protein